MLYAYYVPGTVLDVFMHYLIKVLLLSLDSGRQEQEARSPGLGQCEPEVHPCFATALSLRGRACLLICKVSTVPSHQRVSGLEGKMDANS